jgi:hypothetical protein
MRTFFTTFFAVLLAILASAAVIHFVRARLDSKRMAVSQNQLPPEEAYARQLMKGLSADDVIIACGNPLSDYAADYGDFKWRILVYRNFEVNFILKENRWQYDFASDGSGRI